MLPAIEGFNQFNRLRTSDARGTHQEQSKLYPGEREAELKGMSTLKNRRVTNQHKDPFKKMLTYQHVVFIFVDIQRQAIVTNQKDFHAYEAVGWQS